MASSSHGRTFSTEPISSSISSTSSLAPPCSGPVRVPTAELTTVYGLASVEPVTRPLNVEAFMVCSACRIKQASSTLRTAGEGVCSNSM